MAKLCRLCGGPINNHPRAKDTCPPCRRYQRAGYPRELPSGFVALNPRDEVFDQVVCATFDSEGRLT